jgi:hypothetical protein
VTTNTVEGFFGIFKRGMTGVYQHCGEQHLQRHLDEFRLRYNCLIKLGIKDLDRFRFMRFRYREFASNRYSRSNHPKVGWKPKPIYTTSKIGPRRDPVSGPNLERGVPARPMLIA